MALGQLLCPGFNEFLQRFFLFNRGQCLRNDVCRGFFEMPFASSAEIVRCLGQLEQAGDLLSQTGFVAEIFTGKVGE